MKNALTYCLLVLCTLVLAVGVVFVMMKLKPELFGITTASKKAGIHGASRKVLAPDSSSNVAAAAEVSPDSVKADQHGSQTNTGQQAPASESVVWTDTVAALKKQIEHQRMQIQVLESNSLTRQMNADSIKEVERTKLAKLIDGMNPAGAAQILASMKDEDIKKVLLSVKPRQAGKILGVMDSRRAARLMN